MAVIRDLSSHGKLVLAGPDRVRFLQGMVTNDVAALAPGQGCHAAMLTVKGKLLGDLRIYCDPEALFIETDPEATAKIHDALEKHLIADDATVEDRTRALGEVGVWGEGARAAVESIAGPLPELALFSHVTVGEVRVAGARDLGRAGYRLFGDARALVDQLGRLGGTLLSDEEAEVLRVEAGEPRYGRDMGEEHLPIESRLDAALSFTKGCYLGQEVIVRATQQGRINRKLMGLRLDGTTAAQPGAKLAHPGRADAGTITSSVVSPRFGPIALGYVHRTVFAPGTALTVHDSAGDRAATVVELPFA
jgi:folate-binding protein YgfZ